MHPNGIFVFGSNTAGWHGSGAARFAKHFFGAMQGMGEGLSGNSYAFPTLNANSKGGRILIKRSNEELTTSAALFHSCVNDHPELLFWLTKVGCGLAGYTPDYMRSFFDQMDNANLIKPRGW